MRVFVLALRQPRSMADIARILRVSRQAVHMSVKRLAALKIVALEAAPDNHRDKLVVLTDRGMTARQTAHTQVVMLENECRAALGPEGYATLRELLLKLEPSFVPDYAERRAHSDSNL